MAVIIGSRIEVVKNVAKHAIAEVESWINDNLLPGYKCDKVRLSTSQRAKRSTGGYKWSAMNKEQHTCIYLALHRYVDASMKPLSHTPRFTEYSHYEADPEIGSVAVEADWVTNLFVLVCHEIAHTIELSSLANEIKDEAIRKYLGTGGNHGMLFQEIYRKIRNGVVGKKTRMQHFGITTMVHRESKILNSVKKPSTTKEGFFMELTKSGNGKWFIHKYFDNITGDLLCTLASKPGFKSQVLLNGNWITPLDNGGNHFANHAQTRNHFIDLARKVK